MEAPDRIWIDPLIDLPKLNGHINNDSIEYTRTDAFIKKTEEYLYKQLNEGNMECGDIETFIDEFRKYMEGE